MTTSFGNATFSMAAGSSSVVSTNKGSTFPATRIARIKLLVSAATIGASPAEYTSVKITTSVPEMTRTKSSKQSRVLV